MKIGDFNWHCNCIRIINVFKPITMKKKIICLMVACLSLFAYPFQLSAGSVVALTEKTELPVEPKPGLEKKINEFKRKHPDLFSKKENKEESTSEAAQPKNGGVYYISGTALILIIILLIILL